MRAGRAPLVIAAAMALATGACSSSTLAARYTTSPVMFGPVKTIGQRPLELGKAAAGHLHLRGSSLVQTFTTIAGGSSSTFSKIRHVYPSQTDALVLSETRGDYRRAIVVNNDRIDCSSYGLFAVLYTRSRTQCEAAVTMYEEPPTMRSCPQALHRAAEAGDVAAIRAAAKQGVDLDCRRGGMTALFRAARRGHADAVRALLANGADARRTSDVGSAPAQRRVPTLLVALPHPKVVLLLLAAGSKWSDAWLPEGMVRCALPGQRACKPTAHETYRAWMRAGYVSGEVHADTVAYAKKWRTRRPPLELLEDR